MQDNAEYNVKYYTLCRRVIRRESLKRTNAKVKIETLHLLMSSFDVELCYARTLLRITLW